MTTDPHGTNHRGRPSADARRETEGRIKRRVVVGSLATFVGFFGLTVTADAISDATSGSGDEGAVVMVRYRDGEAVVAQPHARTRSS